MSQTAARPRATIVSSVLERTPFPPRPDVDRLLAALRHPIRERRAIIEIRKKSDNIIGAFARSMLGYDPHAGAEAMREVKARATAISDAVIGGKSYKGDDQPTYAIVAQMASGHMIGRAAMDAQVDDLEDDITTLVRQHHLWPWAERQRGLAEVQFATILSDIGSDIRTFYDSRALRKRMGVGHVAGVAQGRLPAGAPAEDWIRHGYSPARRCTMHLAAKGLVFAGPGREARERGPGVRAQSARDESPWYRAYLDRKARTAAAHPDWSKGHVDNDANRWLGQRLLLALWWLDTGYEPMTGPGWEWVPAVMKH